MRATYSGDLVDGIRHGRGTLTFANGDSYEGEFISGFRHGRGVFTSERGTLNYDGEWRRGYRHGSGKERWLRSGDRYEGEFANDAFHGKGVLVRGSSGAKYDGEFCNGLKHGFGRMEFVNPPKLTAKASTGDVKMALEPAAPTGKLARSGAVSTYVGNWRDGRMYGEGRYTRVDGSFYEGGWVDGLCHGVGREVDIVTGEVYDGGWQSGARHGEGSITRNGKRRRGVWEMGRRVKWTTAEMPVPKQ